MAAVTRLHRGLMLTFNPVVPLGNFVSFVMQSGQDREIVAQPLGTDAKVTAPLASGKPRVLVIVVGETARAENFSLGVYGRDTNPELAKRNITYFTDTTTLGPPPTVSVPRQFSKLH